jgi:hypothetical protein
MTRLLSIVVGTFVAVGQGVAVMRASVPGVRQGTAAPDSVATMLRDAARTGDALGLRWPRFPYYRDELTGLYSGTSWQPVWSRADAPRRRRGVRSTAVERVGAWSPSR